MMTSGAKPKTGQDRYDYLYLISIVASWLFIAGQVLMIGISSWGIVTLLGRSPENINVLGVLWFPLFFAAVWLYPVLPISYTLSATRAYRAKNYLQCRHDLRTSLGLSAFIMLLVLALVSQV